MSCGLIIILICTFAIRLYVYIKVLDTQYVCPNPQKFLSKIRVLNDFVTKLLIKFLWLFLVSCNCCKMIPNRTVKQIWHQNLNKIMAIRKGAYIFWMQKARKNWVCFNLWFTMSNNQLLMLDVNFDTFTFCTLQTLKSYLHMYVFCQIEFIKQGPILKRFKSQTNYKPLL